VRDRLGDTAPRVRLRIIIVAGIGLALVFYLLGHVGWRTVLSAATSVGWGGFIILCAAALLVFLILGPAWRTLLPSRSRLGLSVFVWARMVRDAASEALPVSQVGGMALGVRAAVLQGVASPVAVASMVVDVTTEMLAQIAYIAVGVLILSARAVHTPLTESYTVIFSIGLALAAVAGGAFLALQRYGHHWVARRLVGRLLPRSVRFSTAAAKALDHIYQSRVRVAVSLALHFCAWVAGAAVTWLAFRLIGEPVDFPSVIAIESLVYATRSAGFIIPNAIGVQEAAYTLLAPLVGVGKEFGLAVSLLKRARDLAIGAPILLIWQAVEGRRAVATKDTSSQ
jgi:glycosyltransferase 2 family protein